MTDQTTGPMGAPSGEGTGGSTGPEASWDAGAAGERHACEPFELLRHHAVRYPVSVRPLGVVLVETEVERRQRRHRSRDADSAAGRERRKQAAYVDSGRRKLWLCRRISRKEALGDAHAADVEAYRAHDLAALAQHELR